MKNTLCTFFAAFLFVRAAYGVNFEFISSSDSIPLPDADGSFSNISSEGHLVRHAYFIISEEEYADYTHAVSPSEAIYNAFLANEIGEFCLYDEITDEGYSVIFLDEVSYYDENIGDYVKFDSYFGYNTNACFAALYVYSNETTGVTYYIAEPLSQVTPTKEYSELHPFDIPSFNDIAINAGRWEVVAPPSIDLTCTSFAVTGGNVTATYEISDFPWLEANMVNANGSNTISVIAASDLERTNTTNILANVTATDSATSTFSVTFPAPDATAYPSLFLFGLEKP